MSGSTSDYVDFRPLPNYNSTGSTSGLMVVNHEYTEGARMFREYSPATATREQVDVELAAHGLTVVELDARRQVPLGVRAVPRCCTTGAYRDHPHGHHRPAPGPPVDADLGRPHGNDRRSAR